MVSDFTNLVSAHAIGVAGAMDLRKRRRATPALPSGHAIAKTAKLRMPDGKFGALLEPLGEAREMS
jgi:hypothetical protein